MKIFVSAAIFVASLISAGYAAPPDWRPTGEAAINRNGETIVVNFGRRLDGIAAAVNVEPRQRHTLRCEARGEGRIQLGGHGALGWSYAPPVTLSSVWQPCEISYADAAGTIEFSIYSAQDGSGYFELRNPAVTPDPEPELADAEIAARFFDPIDFPGDNGSIAPVADAWRGEAVRGKRWYRVCRLPVPHTSCDLYYYIHLRKDSDKSAAAFLLRVPGGQAVSNRVPITAADRWQWVKIGPVAAGCALPEVALSFDGEPDVEILTDRIALSTSADLDPAAIDNGFTPGSAKDSGGESSSFPLRPDDSLIAVGHGTPAIDGIPDDAAWRRSIAATPFLLAEKNIFAREQTAVRFLRDEENLYVLFQCHERALEPSENRLHELKTNASEPDSDAVYADDCVTLLLQNPKSPDSVFDITVSASGQLADSAGSAGDLWSRRDRSWNSAAAVAVKLNTVDDDGFWTTEMAIPWKNLGGPPASGACWRMLAARSERSRNETSSFQAAAQADPRRVENMGGLSFIDNVPAIVPEELPQFTPGANHLKLNCNAQTPLLASSLIRFGAAGKRFNAEIPAGQPTADLAFDLADNGDFDFTWSIFRQTDMQTCFRSPRCRFATAAAQLTAELRNATLLVNGAAADGSAMLSAGVNELTVRAGENGEVKLRSGGFAVPFPAGWKYDAEQQTHHLKLLAGDSVIWPNWNWEGVFVNRGGVQQLLFAPRGVPGATPDDYSIYLDLPENFTLLGASGCYRRYRIVTAQPEEIELAGQRFTRHRITVAQPLPFREQPDDYEYIAALIGVSPETKLGPARIFYHAESRKAGTLELPNQLPVTVLDRAVGRQPSKFIVQLWTGWLGELDDKTLYQHYGRYFSAAGVTEVNGLNHSCAKLKHFALINFEPWNLDCSPYIEHHPEQALTDPAGVRSRKFICPKELLNNPDCADFLAAALTQWYERHHRPEHINLDYEYDVLESCLACFCPACRNDFAAQYTLPETPSAAEIKTKLLRQWTGYMNRRMADVTTMLRRAVSRKFPNVRFSVYSGYQSAETMRVYGVDWSRLDGKIDLAMTGYGRPIRELEATRHALPSTPLMTGLLASPHRHTDRGAPQYISPAQLLRRACDATAGVLIYCYPTLDGRSFAAIAEVSSIIAANEPFFLRGDRHGDLLKINGFDPADYEVLSDGGGNWLVALMNPGNAKRDFTFDLPAAAGHVLRDFQTGERLRPPVSGTIAPHGVIVYVSE
ncbi:MAG: carbohydrate-binding family 9-like protein [Victivallaceae bacterium]|nr:carbohydrate-binding family 9-like protein [Victivallaceae bacterium]